jgi:hypothetical protein
MSDGENASAPRDPLRRPCVHSSAAIPRNAGNLPGVSSSHFHLQPEDHHERS